MATTKRGKKRQHYRKQAALTCIHKKKWTEPVVYRVRLDPNQAVLTCCIVTTRGVQNWYSNNTQCVPNNRQCGPATSLMVS